MYKIRSIAYCKRVVTVCTANACLKVIHKTYADSLQYATIDKIHNHDM